MHGFSWNSSSCARGKPRIGKIIMSKLHDHCADAMQQQDEQPVRHPEFKITRKLADEVLELVDTHHTPPFPRTYEVWYTYAAGSNELVTNQIDMTIRNAGSLNTYEIDQIHGEYLSSNGQEDINSTIQSELDSILKLIQEHLSCNEDFSGSLDRTMANLNDSSSPAQLRKTIELLITDNKKMRAETTKLTDNLEQSKSQIQEIREELAEARENEMRDPVTSLGNRRLFETSLARIIKEAKSYESETCLAFIDIDHFKRVNDTFGHTVGDQVLKYFGSLLIKNVKGQDICVRYGGEEFAVILPDTKFANARLLMESIRAQIEASNLMLSKSNKPIGRITASFGLVKVCEGDDPKKLVQRADTKLYEAKNSGRNCIVCED